MGKKEGLKDRLRREYLKKRKSLSEEEVEDLSKRVRETFLNSFLFKDFSSFMLYYPIKNEVNLLPLLKVLLNSKKRVYMPKVLGDEIFPVRVIREEFVRGRFGIPEAEGELADKGEVELAFVPGIVFDRLGYRIGFGKGFYDRFLKDFKGLKVGVLYPFQLVEKLPCSPWDEPVDLLLLPNKILKGGGRNERGNDNPDGDLGRSCSRWDNLLHFGFKEEGKGRQNFVRGGKEGKG